jgi:hypothetical protein
MLAYLYDCPTKGRIDMFISTIIGNNAGKLFNLQHHQIVRSLEMRKLFFFYGGLKLSNIDGIFQIKLAITYTNKSL